ncbi:hypothetical protein ES332_A11G193800v1 [Gossypium tomentosum]|uniref:Uncharacterized protein n=1 Tax=Gossypium tomentosum TaxID=34277 RepID=A0A5D2NGH1_GOSTO|nr:hypothetical protein ES332_A11G193800v1 [Gossypium tomentosum]
MELRMERTKRTNIPFRENSQPPTTLTRKKKLKTLSFPLFIFTSLKQTSLSPSSSEKAPILPSEYSSPSYFPWPKRET